MKAIETPAPSRRDLMKSLGAGLMIAVAAPAFAQPGLSQREGGGQARTVNLAARLHIGADNSITVMTGKVEGGQGARAEITAAAAEELHVAPGRITLIMGDTDLTPDDGGTHGSQTTPRTIPVVRQACASARQILVALAAKQWTVPADQIVVKNGLVSSGDHRATFGELVGDDSAKVFATSPQPGVLVSAVKDWKVLGTAQARPNARDIVTGAHVYPSCVVRTGMLYGKVLRAPAFGATLKKIDTAVAKSATDVVVIQDGDFTGVAAPTTHRARQAIELMEKSANWTMPAKPVDSDQLFEHLRATARGGEAALKNPFEDDLKTAKHVVRQTYQVAYAQHAPMEPRAAVAEWENGKLTVWTGTQHPVGVRDELMRAFGLDAQHCRVIVPDFGGGFGGKHSGECAVEAARLAKGAGKPVRLVWTREEEFTHAYFRPAALILAEAGLDDAGKITSWSFINVNSGAPGIETPYRVNQKKTQFVQAESPLRMGSYRALASTANHFARECFMDELARAANVDAVDFRIAHLDEPRLTAVLNAVKEKYGVLSPAADSHRGVGFACGTEKGSYVAACAEVFVDPSQNTFKITRIIQAFECGKILNPANLMSQVQGAVVMGLGPALREAVAFKDGTVSTDTFADYAVPRFADVPPIEVVLLDRPDLPSAGAGETPIVTIAPAIANAVFRAMGRPVTTMPIRLAAQH